MHSSFGECVALTAVDGSSCLVSLHGGQVLSWATSDGVERLFLASGANLTNAQRAIRGGIPVCFPQFGSLGPLPKHGYARSELWRHRGSGRFVLDVSPDRWVGFPHACALEINVTLGPGSLCVSFTVDNVGPDAFTFTGALHTYLSVDDVSLVRVDGLAEAGVEFACEVDLQCPSVSGPAVISVSGEPTMVATQTGFGDAVVWNIGTERAGSLAELEPDEWSRYVCVEAASLSAVEVAPGLRWSATQTLIALTMESLPTGTTS